MKHADPITHTLMLSRLMPGQMIICEYGRSATQLAVVVRPGGAMLTVRKWRRNSHSWTKNVRIPAGYVFRPATNLDTQERGLTDADVVAACRDARYNV